MSESIAEIADREAREAEAEFPDPEEAPSLADEDTPTEADPADDHENAGDDPEPDPEPDPVGSPPSSETEMEEIGKKLDQEAARHTKAVAKIMGDSMGDLVNCPLCVTPGFVLVQPPADFDTDQRQAVLTAMGDGGEYEPQQDPDLETCDRCKGLGVMLTGARNEPNYTINCSRCHSKGYVNPKDLAVQEQAFSAATTYTPPPPFAGVPVPPSPGTVPTPPRPEPWLDYSVDPAQWRI